MEDKILSILTGIRPEFDFTQSNDFIADGMLDSFDLVYLVTELDKAYGISIEGTDIIPDNFANISAITHMLLKYKIKA